MKQNQFVKAYLTVQSHENDKLPLNVSYAFYKLKKNLQTQWDFQVEKEREIMEKYHPTTNEQGMYQFESDEARSNFGKELTDLAQLEVPMDFDKVHIDMNSEINFSVAEIEALDEFVEF